MNRIAKWFHCMMAGHPMSISYIERFDGTPWATSESCSCGFKRQLCWPGTLVKAHHEAYADYPDGWRDFYAEP